MSKAIDKKREPEKAKTTPRALEIDPDAWPKFEALIKSAAKIGPKPHAAIKAKRAPSRVKK